MAAPLSPNSPSEPTVLLRHGTTKLRADHIFHNGPDPNLVVGGDTANGLSTAPLGGPYPLGAPEDYARGKARNFPQEGGPAILEIEVPASIVALAVHPGGEVLFLPGFGLEELLTAWPQLSKRVYTP
jgi:hypothetical protein